MPQSCLSQNGRYGESDQHRTVESYPRAVAIRIEVPEMCARYSALAIRNIAVKPSSPHVAKRLEAIGLRPINNIVDITNYVMIALGHPLHAFDLDLVNGQTIIVRRGKAGETMKTLDGEMRKIDPDTVVIAAEKAAVGLGGVMGGFEAEAVHDGLLVTVPTYRGDIHEEMDLIEEVLRFFGLNNVPAELPRMTTGDVRREAADVAEDTIRDVLAGCGLSEAINYSFI